MLLGNQASVMRRNLPHSHDMHELVVCAGDTGRHWVNGITYDLKAGMSIFLPSGHPHFVEGTPEDPAEIMFVCFDQAFLAQTGDENFFLAMLQSGKERRYASPNESMHNSLAIMLMSKIFEELAARRSWSEAMAASLVRQLLVAHCRSVTSGGRTDAGAIVGERVAQIARRIAESPEKDYRIDLMAARAGMSRSVFTRAFKRHTGMSLIEFVNDARVRRAMTFLTSQPQEPVSAVALKSGLRNLGHFHSVFQALCGTSPRRYRAAVIANGPFPWIMKEYRKSPEKSV